MGNTVGICSLVQEGTRQPSSCNNQLQPSSCFGVPPYGMSPCIACSIAYDMKMFGSDRRKKISVRWRDSVLRVTDLLVFFNAELLRFL